MARPWIVPAYSAAALLAGIALGEFPDPKLTAVDPPGGQRGSTTEVTVLGTDLDEATGLVFSHAGITARPVQEPAADVAAESQPVPGKMSVSIADDVPVGVHDVQVVCRHGVSNPRRFVVGRTRELRKAGAIDTPQKALAIPLESAVSARAEANVADHYAVECRAGERVHVEIWARRIESRITPVLAVLDPEGRELRATVATVGEDATIDFTPTRAGRHVIRVHDRYAGGGDGFFYRLTVTTGPVLLAIFPPAVNPASPEAVTVVGRGLGEGATPLADGETTGLEEKTVPLSPGDIVAGLSVRPARRLFSPRDAAIEFMALRGGLFDAAVEEPAVMRVDLPVVRERESNDDPATPQPLPRRAAVAGRFHPRGDRDWFSFEAKAGEPCVLEVFSRRLGAMTDVALLVESVETDAQGEPLVKELAYVDDGPQEFQGQLIDQPTLDPILLFQPPADGIYRVRVREQAVDVIADPTAAYVLEVRDPRPDFDLVAIGAWPDRADASKLQIGSTVLAGGGTVAFDVVVLRRDGFEGDVMVEPRDLPPGVTGAPILIPAGARRGIVVLEADDDARPGVQTIRLVGRAEVGGSIMEREAHPTTVPWSLKNHQREPHRLRRTDAIRIAVTADAAPVTVRPRETKAWETARGGKLTIPLDVVHRAGAKGPVALTPVTYPLELKLPAELRVPEVKIPEVAPAAGQSAEPHRSGCDVAVDIDPKVAPGVYTLILRGVAKRSYVRKPEAAARADAAAASGPKDIDVPLFVRPIRLVVDESPVAPAVVGGPVGVKAGGMADLVVDVERKHGFVGPVVLEARCATPVPGLAIQAATVAPESSRGILRLTTTAATPPGTHAITLTAKVLFFDREVACERNGSVVVTREEAAKP